MKRKRQLPQKWYVRSIDGQRVQVLNSEEWREQSRCRKYGVGIVVDTFDDEKSAINYAREIMGNTAVASIM